MLTDYQNSFRLKGCSHTVWDGVVWTRADTRTV